MSDSPHSASELNSTLAKFVHAPMKKKDEATKNAFYERLDEV